MFVFCKRGEGRIKRWWEEFSLVSVKKDSGPLTAMAPGPIPWSGNGGTELDLKKADDSLVLPHGS